MKAYFQLLSALLLSVAMFAQHPRNADKLAASSATHAGLVGTWRLIEFADFDTTASRWTYSYGKHPMGYFTYTKSGIVNLNICAEKPVKISRDSAKVFSIDLTKWVDSNAVGYFGTYSVNYSTSVVTHHVKGGSLPWYIDTDQQRPFLLKADTLLIGDNKTWRRVLVKVD